jgi:hypothetical protein
MKKLTEIILLLLISVIGYGQNKQDTTGDVCIPYPVIKNIQTDLLIGDSAKAMLNVSSSEIALLRRQVFDQMNLIDSHKASEKNFQQQVDNLKQQLGIHVTMYNTVEKNFNKLSKEYKRAKVKHIVTDMFLGLGIALVTERALYYRRLWIRHM